MKISAFAIAALLLAAAFVGGSPAATSATAGQGLHQWVRATFGSSRAGGPRPVVITFHVATTTSYSYDPSNAKVTQLSAPRDPSNPIAGVVTVVKKNPSGAFVGATSGENGIMDLPKNLSAGEYSVVVKMPRSALNPKDAASGGPMGSIAGQAASVDFGATVDAGGAMRVTRFNTELY